MSVHWVHYELHLVVQLVRPRPKHHIDVLLRLQVLKEFQMIHFHWYHGEKRIIVIPFALTDPKVSNEYHYESDEFGIHYCIKNFLAVLISVALAFLGSDLSFFLSVLDNEKTAVCIFYF